MSTVLFVGGCADGLRVAMQHVMPTYVVTQSSERPILCGTIENVPTVSEIRRDVYFAEVLSTPSAKFHFYRHQRLTLEMAIGLIFTNYQSENNPTKGRAPNLDRSDR